MATISISELRAGSDLLMDSESFLNDLGDHEVAGVTGGFDITFDDWCGTTKFTLTRTITTSLVTTFPTKVSIAQLDVSAVVAY